MSDDLTLVQRCAEKIRQVDTADWSRVKTYPELADVLVPIIEEEVREAVINDLRRFLPEWNYPDYVVAAICLELRSRGESHDNGS